MGCAARKGSVALLHSTIVLLAPDHRSSFASASTTFSQRARQQTSRVLFKALDTPIVQETCHLRGQIALQTSYRGVGSDRCSHLLLIRLSGALVDGDRRRACLEDCHCNQVQSSACKCAQLPPCLAGR